jgi:hypothetical protein
MKDGQLIASFLGESPFKVCVFSNDSSTILAVDQFGQVHSLCLENWLKE